MENKLVVGVIGLKMGKNHLEGAICDTLESTLNAVGDEYNIPADKRFLDYRDVVDNKDINAVIIATPDQLHRQMILDFLAAGKHILCEKPLALTRDDLKTIIAAVRKYDHKFMVGQICRFTPAFVKAKEIIDAGIIGDLYYVESEYAHDYAHILGDPENWRADPIRHGVIGGGCHPVDLLRWFAGDPEEVFAYGTHKMMSHLCYDDATISVLKFPNNIIGKVFVSIACKRNYTMRTLIYGTKGTIICDNTSSTMQLFSTEDEGRMAAKPQIIEVEVNDHNAVREFAVFADAILNDTSIEMSAGEGAKTVAVCLAIVESSQIGKPVNPDYNF
jgi:predicted dehydrogenase